MKVLSLHPVEATLVALGVKPTETRSWQAPSLVGQRFAIAATQGIPGMRRGEVRTYGAYTVERDDPRGCAPAYLLRGPTLAWPYRLPTGAIVATCVLSDVVPIVELGEETAVRRIEVGTMAGEPNLMLCAPHPQSKGFDHLLGFNLGPEDAIGQEDDPEPGVDFDVSDYYEKDVTAQLPYGDWSAGRYAWLLHGVVTVTPPVLFKGGQGLTMTWEP